MMESVRIAVVHDWVTGMRGGERVLDVLARAFPDSDLYTLFYKQGVSSVAIDSLQPEVSPLGRLPGVTRYYRSLLPLYPWAADQLDIEGYDLVLSVSHAVAKNVSLPSGIPHLSYCLTPMRYVWDQVDAYLGHGPRRVLAAPLVHALRRYDRQRSEAERVHRFVAISNTVASRIEQHYGRSSTVVFPPVDTERIRPSGSEPEDFYLLVGGFVPYKQEEIAIEAFRGRKEELVVVGDGPARARLMKGAPSNVRFTGRITDEELVGYFQRCRALIYPQEEDFGIAAVEAQAAGRPVIAYGRGGSLDTVRPLLTVGADGEVVASGQSGCTGLFFAEQSSRNLALALDAFRDRQDELDASEIRHHAEGFAEERFVDEMKREMGFLIGP